MQKKAIILLSGGLDSTTTLAIAAEEGYQLYALSFDYGQRHKRELQAATQIAQKYKVKEHKTIPLALDKIGGSALTSDIEVPKNNIQSEYVPATYVPARNLIFLSIALAYAEVIEASDIFIGVNCLDYSNYPDCRAEFLKGFTDIASLATAAGKFQIRAPLLYMNKEEIVREGIRLGVDYSLTTSCYDPMDDMACGECDACILRLKGFAANNISDPISYIIQEVVG